MTFPIRLPQKLLRSVPCPPAVTFRLARPADVEPLHLACYSHLSLSYFRAGFMRTLADQRAGQRLCLVALRGGKDGMIVGSGLLVRYTGWRAEIADLAVAPMARGQGIGTALIEVATLLARRAGITVLEIGAMADNDRAFHLYRRLGFRPDREILLPGGEVARILRKEID